MNQDTSPGLDFELELQLREYIDAHRIRILAHCRRFTHDFHDAEDALQQTFIALAKHLRIMRDRGETLERPLAWLLQVSKRCSIDTVRARKRRRNHERAAAGQRDEVSVNATSTVEARLAVQQALDTLPAPYRTPLILFYFGGQDLDTIAKQLSMTTNAVSVKLHRGRAMLEKRLRSRGVIVPAIALPLLLAEAVRLQVLEGAGTSLMIGGATTLHASNPILCGNSLVALSSTDPIIPAATLFHVPLNSRLILAFAAMIFTTAVSVGGSGLMNDVRRYTPKWNWNFNLIETVQDYLSDLPRLVAQNQETPATATLAESAELPWVVASKPAASRVDRPEPLSASRVPDYFAPRTQQSILAAPSLIRRDPSQVLSIASKPAEQFKRPDPFVKPGDAMLSPATFASRAGGRSAGEIASEMIRVDPIETKPAPGISDGRFLAVGSSDSGGSVTSVTSASWDASNSIHLSYSTASDAMVAVGNQQALVPTNPITPINPLTPVSPLTPINPVTPPTAPVITPEPGTGLLVLAATALIRRRRRDLD